MRLIDADKLNAELEEKWQYYHDKFWETRYSMYRDSMDALDSAIYILDAQPTVQPQGIDKDRLIEKIEPLQKQAFEKYTERDSDYWETRYDAITEIIDIINQQPQTGWIPVSERLPDMENVLGTTEECEIKMVWYNPNLKKWFGSPVVHIENVIAWQPLPQPYKESEEE